MRNTDLDITLKDVCRAYSGPVGALWEMVMGEQIHVGGEADTTHMAEMVALSKKSHVLDICSALGGPARQLAQDYGCRVTGLDATERMVAEAKRRTREGKCRDHVIFKRGNALDLPFQAGTFDLVWGQDAWCYVTDKERLLLEAHRVLKPEGGIAFTDWIQTGAMMHSEQKALNAFMLFPSMETSAGYERLLRSAGFEVIGTEDLSDDFRQHCHHYERMLQEELKDPVIERFGPEFHRAVLDGWGLWVRAADAGKVGRGRWVGKKRVSPSAGRSG
jgi:ubiquinone/menaquinone biosynthesis C-methylase UbiE